MTNANDRSSLIADLNATYLVCLVQQEKSHIDIFPINTRQQI